MNPAMSGSPSKHQSPQKRKREIDSNDADQINSKHAGMDISPKPTDQQARLPLDVIARIGTGDCIIEQAFTDKRDYCYFKLDNGLQVLVVSDSECEMANVNLLVNCGSINDPKSLPGLAHYLEHMIYLTNTDDYLQINQLHYYLWKHGGQFQAQTKFDRTNYSFTVLSDHLSNAMNRFSHAIVHPKFDKILLRKEVNAIDTEFLHHQKNNEEEQFWTALLEANLNHPCGQFACGNKDTLYIRPQREGVDVQVEMKKLYNNHYISSNMCLVVIGKQTTDMLRKMVMDSKFRGMPNKILLPVRLDHVIKETNREACINYDIQTSTKLQIQWKINGYSRWYPVKYINTLMENKGPNGPLAILKENKCAYDIHADFEDICANSTIYYFVIYLTLEGIENTEYVVGVIYSYIQFLKENQVPKELDEMCKDMAEYDFLYNQNREDYARFLCGRLWDVCNHSLSEGNILKGYALPREGADMMDFLEQLRPNNGRIIISGFDIQGKHAKTKFSNFPQTDELYGMNYGIHEISPKTIQKWEKSDIKNIFHFPDVNTYYPVNKSFVAPEISLEPELILNTKLCKVWYKQESPVLKPFASFRLCVTHAYPNKEHNKMFLALWENRLQHLFYQGKFGGLTCTFENEDNFFTVLVEGYPQCLKAYVETIMKMMDEVFEVTEEEYYDVLLYRAPWDGDYKSFRKGFDKMLCKKLLFLVCGQISKDDALALCNKVKVLFIGPADEQKEEERITNTDDAYDNPQPLLRYTKNRKEFCNEDRYVLAEFDCTAACANLENAIVDLFCHVLFWDCSTYLRTFCTLAYEVYMFSKHSSKMVIVVKAEGNHDIVQTKIEDFLRDIINIRLGQLSDKTLEDHKACLEKEYKLKPINQRKAHSRYWTRLLKSTFAIDEQYFTILATFDENYIAGLRKITMSDLKKFYKEYIHPDGGSVIYTIAGDFKENNNSVYAQVPQRINSDVRKCNETIIRGDMDDDEYKILYEFLNYHSPDRR